MHSPLISIIIPVFNTEKYLKKCLDSILSNEESDIEVILVNDGSSDNSSNICNKYADNNCRITLYNQSNLGVATARNKGLELASGQWIWFIDSDDYIMPGAIDILRSYIRDNARVDCFFFELIEEKEGILNIEIINSKTSDAVYINNRGINEFLIKKVSYTNPTILFKRNIIQNNNLQFTPGIKLGEDLEFQYKYLCYVKKPYYINKTIYVYRRHEGSATKNEETDKINLRDNFQITNNLLSFTHIKNIHPPEWFEFRIRQLLKSGLQSAERCNNLDIRNTHYEFKTILKRYRKSGFSNIEDTTLKLAKVNLKLYFIALRLFYKIKRIK